jgi:hypothetical protein
MNEEKAPVEVSEEVETFGSSIDFNNLFRVKGKQGLFVPNSTVNKSGLINMVGFLDRKNSHTVLASSLVRLGDLSIITTESENCSLSEAFDNLHSYYELLPKKSAEEMMAVICPNYDDSEFKVYHAKRILEWYDIVSSRISEFGEEEKK